MNVVNTIIGLFGTQAAEPSAAPFAPLETEIGMAQQEFHQAQRALRQAEANFENAAPEYIFMAIDEMNVASLRVSTTTRKLKMLCGIPLRQEDRFGQ